MSVRELISADSIDNRVKWMASAISEDYRSRGVVLVPILKGSFIFASDLVRKISLKDVTVEFISVSSYGDSEESSGVVRITHDLDGSIEGKHILLVEDIVDSGCTLSYLISQLKSRNPASIGVAALLRKPSRQRVPVQLDYVGFNIDDQFVVGYGLDSAQRYRGIPYIGVVEV